MGSGMSLNPIESISRNWLSTVLRRAASGRKDHVRPGPPTQNVVITHRLSSGKEVSRVKTIGPLGELKQPDHGVDPLYHHGSLNTSTHLEYVPKMLDSPSSALGAGSAGWN